MKKTSFLFLSAAALLFTSASAALNETSSAMVALPTYVVEAGRGSAAEQSVQRSLDALRDLARAPITVSVDLPALKAQVSVEAKILSGARLAKF